MQAILDLVPEISQTAEDVLSLVAVVGLFVLQFYFVKKISAHLAWFRDNY